VNDNLPNVPELAPEGLRPDSEVRLRTLLAGCAIHVLGPDALMPEVPELSTRCSRRTTELGSADCAGDVIHRAEHWIAYEPGCAGCTWLIKETTC
jgi:hypothetical protein